MKKFRKDSHNNKLTDHFIYNDEMKALSTSKGTYYNAHKTVLFAKFIILTISKIVEVSCLNLLYTMMVEKSYFQVSLFDIFITNLQTGFEMVFPNYDAKKPLRKSCLSN